MVQGPATLKGPVADGGDPLVHLNGLAVVLAPLQTVVLDGQAVHGLRREVTDHGADELFAVLHRAVVGVGEQDLEGRWDHGVIQIDGVQALAVLPCHDDLHAAEG